MSESRRLRERDDATGPGPFPDASPSAHRSERLRHHAYIVCCAVAVVAKLWLTLAFGLRAAGLADADDRLFVVLAEHLVNGDWLGPYDRYTLAKGPFYPLWIAAAFLAHIPLPLSYQIAHVCACALLVMAVRPLVPSRSGRLVFFIVLLFDPSTYSAVASWVVREGIYAPLTMAILACLVALLTRLAWRPRLLVPWSLGLGATLAAFWLTREEGIWIVPAASIALLYGLVSVRQAQDAFVPKTALLILPAVLCTTGVLGVAALNHHHYGVFTVVDFKSPEFKRANGALMRVRHEQWNQYANVPREARQKIYAVSPAFAELAHFLDGPPGLAWGRGAEAWLKGGTASPADIRGGFFVWALRQAAHQAGYYRSARETETYFARVADEINAACDDGRLDCGRPRASLTPPWRPEYLQLVARSLAEGLRKLATLDEVEVFNMPSAGPLDRMIVFEDIARARINPLMGDTGEFPRLPNQARLDRLRFELLGHLNTLYKTAAPIATAAAMFAFLVVCALELRARSFSPALLILVMILVSVLARMAILSLISVTSFEAMKLRYLMPLYPLLFVFWFLSIHHTGHLLRAVAIEKRTSHAQPANAPAP